MSVEPEPLAAILAEMRDERIIRLDGADVTRCMLLNLADRIEAAAKREMNEAAEFINDYLQEIPVWRKPHDWLVRNGYTDTSYQNDVFAEEDCVRLARTNNEQTNQRTNEP